MRFAVSKLARLALIPFAGLALAPEAFACYATEPVVAPSDPVEFPPSDKIICKCPTGGCSESTQGTIERDESVVASQTIYLAANEAPASPATGAPVALSCEGGGGGALCEAFPQALDYGDLTYGWYTTGKVVMTYMANPYNPFYSFGCSGNGSGSVAVRVGHGTASVMSSYTNVYCSIY